MRVLRHFWQLSSPAHALFAALKPWRGETDLAFRPSLDPSRRNNYPPAITVQLLTKMRSIVLSLNGNTNVTCAGTILLSGKNTGLRLTLVRSGRIRLATNMAYHERAPPGANGPSTKYCERPDNPNDGGGCIRGHFYMQRYLLGQITCEELICEVESRSKWAPFFWGGGADQVNYVPSKSLSSEYFLRLIGNFLPFERVHSQLPFLFVSSLICPLETQCDLWICTPASGGSCARASLRL